MSHEFSPSRPSPRICISAIINEPAELETCSMEDVRLIFKRWGYRETEDGCGDVTITSVPDEDPEHASAKNRALVRSSDDKLLELGVNHDRRAFHIGVLQDGLNMNEGERTELARTIIYYRTTFPYAFAEGPAFTEVVQSVLRGEYGVLHLQHHYVRALISLLHNRKLKKSSDNKSDTFQKRMA